MQLEKNFIRDFEEVYKKTEYNCYDFEGKTVLVCGGAGFLGSLFVKYFLYLNGEKVSYPCKIIKT